MDNRDKIEARLAKGFCRFGEHPNDRNGLASSCTECNTKYKTTSKREMGLCKAQNCYEPVSIDGRCKDCHRMILIRSNQDPEFCKCGNPRQEPNSPCQECRERANNQYKHNKERHLENNKAAIKRNRARRKAAGLCTNPSSKDHPNDRIGLGNYCSECANSGTKRDREKENRRRADGFCPKCPEKEKVPLESFITACPKCICRGRARKLFGDSGRWQDLYYLWEAQQRCCVISGVPIVLGYNAELDHIVPKSKGGLDTLDNLNWVHKIVNQGKWDGTYGEFVEVAYATVLNHQLGMLSTREPMLFAPKWALDKIGEKHPELVKPYIEGRNWKNDPNPEIPIFQKAIQL